MSNSTHWISPSNIAIIKYWGKLPDQIPMNTSFSFTLSESKTNTSVFWSEKSKESDQRFSLLFEGRSQPDFEPKIKMFLQTLDKHLPWLKKWFLEIHSSNTFPHSSGIASSASAMSALALCIGTFEKNLISEIEVSQQLFLQRCSWFARMGSGSACRSVFPFASLWGQHIGLAESSNEFGVPMEQLLHGDFKTLCDYIFIVNAGEKSVSSTAGHALMDHHFFRDGRIAQAEHHLKQLMPALQSGDWPTFIAICESEALSLHGLMMSSQPAYVLLQADSLRILHEIQSLRKSTMLPVCFTIDAGPNIHMLFPESCKPQVESWLAEKFSDYLTQGRLLRDKAGAGPICLI
ncbi:MAG: diphosphomevalonate decarboxylase [Saprospiraceae bacterium]|nr:diphosphomevalonate decarboxylase [Saprospiraceae bacterium]